jgi:uncharacterized protein (TIGR03067 family)
MRTLVTLLVFAAPLVAAPVPKALKKADALGGEWQVVEWHLDGERMQLSDDIRWVIDGEQVAVAGKKEAVPVGFQSDVTRQIKRTEGGEANAVEYIMTPTDGGRPTVRPAVIELTADTFKLCMTDMHNGPRPTACAPAVGTIMFVLKRVEADK